MKPEGAGAGPGFLGRPARRSTVLRQASLKKKKKSSLSPSSSTAAWFPVALGCLGHSRVWAPSDRAFPQEKLE